MMKHYWGARFWSTAEQMQLVGFLEAHWPRVLAWPVPVDVVSDGRANIDVFNPSLILRAGA